MHKVGLDVRALVSNFISALMSHPGFGAPRPGREQSPGVLGPSLTHMMNHGTRSNVTYLLYNKSFVQNK
jgi:hypothetical protein